MPSHVNIKGNEKADLLAKKALGNNNIDGTIQRGNKEALLTMENEVENMWQKQWTGSKTGKCYKTPQPQISKKIKY
jgi:hypothetical protein